ncbi:MAG: HAD family hydrolase [Candidatus Marsarchaeota archaeon]|nr:HAD family hydrolase [Candidatus Marsarchaeota archaeon]
MIKVIVFDAQGTLFSSISKNEKIRNVLKDQGYDKSIAEIDDAFAMSRRIAIMLRSKGIIKLDEAGYLIENEIRFMLLGFNDEQAEALAKIMNEKWTDASNRKPYPEVMEVLEHLQASGFRLGLLTAGAATSYTKTLEKEGLLKYFAFVFGEDTTNIPKPDPKAYKRVIKESKCGADEILFVGDDLINDYEGPRKSGMKAVLVDRNNEFGNDIAKISDLKPFMSDSFIKSF